MKDVMEDYSLITGFFVLSGLGRLGGGDRVASRRAKNRSIKSEKKHQFQTPDVAHDMS